MDRGSGADRIETRELAYFIAVAETCHFGRAAQRLGIAQPPLSRAISRLERRLGVVLLERTSRRVALTVAGEVLLAEGRRALDTIDTAVARARTAARPRLRLALKPGGDGGLLAPILAAYRDEPCAVEVELVPCAAGEQTGLLRRGAADAALVQGHQPDLDQLDSEVLLVEPQVVALAGDHPLAGAATLRLADVAANLLPATRVALDPAAALQLVAGGGGPRPGGGGRCSPGRHSNAHRHSPPSSASRSARGIGQYLPPALSLDHISGSAAIRALTMAGNARPCR
jgi:DNA-binding transcriptional LysR family regulator